MIGNLDKGMKTLHNYHQVWKQYGFTPEFYNIPKGEAQSNRDGYPLRPGKNDFWIAKYIRDYLQPLRICVCHILKTSRFIL